MSDVGQACTDLAAWLTPAAELITQPDTDGTQTRGKPHSQPPWNPAAANAIYDIHAAVRVLEQDLRFTVTGSFRTRGGSDGNTRAALESIPKLAAGADELAVDVIVRQLDRLLTAVLQLPAIDLEKRPVPIAAPCPRCSRRMLRWRRSKSELICLGCIQKATLHDGHISGQPLLQWDDGEITIGPAPEGTTP